MNPRQAERIRPGALVQWIEIAPHPARGHIYGRIVEVCSGCDEALIRWYTGVEERVPLSAFGRDRPRASVRLAQE